MFRNKQGLSPLERGATLVAGCVCYYQKMGILGVEMEAAGLYGVAAEYGKNALAIVTISDHIRTGEQTTAEERQNTFNDMVEIALKSL